MANELEMSDAEWAAFYQRKLLAMAAAGQAYVEAGGRSGSEFERVIMAAWPDASESAYRQARKRVKIPEREVLND